MYVEWGVVECENFEYIVIAGTARGRVDFRNGYIPGHSNDDDVGRGLDYPGQSIIHPYSQRRQTTIQNSDRARERTPSSGQQSVHKYASRDEQRVLKTR
jgi:hypothetical protein